jgi:hypothetical protein
MAAITMAHNALIGRYVGELRHLDGGDVKSFSRIVVELGGLMTRHTVRRTVRMMFPEIADAIRARHTTAKRVTQLL